MAGSIQASEENKQLAALIGMGPQSAPTPEFKDKSISLDLRDIDVNEALKFLASKANLNIIPTKEVGGRITLMVDDVPVKDVFDIMLRSNNLAYDKQGTIYNVMTEKEFKARYGKNFTDLRQVKVLHINYTIPDNATNLLNAFKSEVGKVMIDADSGAVLIMDTPEKISDMEEAVKAMEKMSDIRIFSLKYARAKEVETQLQVQLDLKKVGYIKADERTNQVIVQTLPERMEQIIKLIDGLDKKTKQVLIDAKIVQVKLNNQLSSGIQWEGIFNLGINNGLTYIGAYPFSYVVNGTASTAGWKSREQTYEQLGSVGSYPFTGTSIANFSVGKQSIGTEEMHLGMAAGGQDFDTIIKYLQTLGETRILSNPKLAVINNQEAKIHVGEKQAYITTTTTKSQSTDTVSEAVTFIDVGLQLFLTPTINDDGFVTLKIKPEISSVLDYLETGQGNKIPIIDTSTAETTVMAKQGTTILVGGLSREEKVTNSQATPFLGKIPFLGKAFSQDSTKVVRSELLVLITPHIIEGDELVTGYDRDLQYRLDKEYQDYKPINEEPLSGAPKIFQDYPKLSKDERAIDIKPARISEGEK